MTRSVLTLALLAVSAAGCKQPVLCPALDACGGPAPLSLKGETQEWVLAPGHPSCTEDLYVPANDTRLPQSTLTTTGKPYPEPALFDWCLLLVSGPGAGGQVAVKTPRFYYESGPIGVVSLKYEPIGHFSAGITRTGTFSIDLPAYCVRAFGAMDGPLDPTDPMTPTVPVCKRLEVPIAAAGLGEGSYRNTTCEANTDEQRAQWGLDGAADPYGCICRFDVTETGGPSGSFQLIDSNTIMHLPGTNFPQKATYCYQGDRLELTGADGAYLFDQRGVRTFDLVRACAVDADCVSKSCKFDATTSQGYCQ